MSDFDRSGYGSDSPELRDLNADVVAEFRANGGRVGGPFTRSHLLLLHSTGAKSGEPRTHPLAYVVVDGRTIILGSYAGGPKNPAWVHNLRANPAAHVEIGSDSYDVLARELPRDERDVVFPKVVATAPFFGEYQAKTERVIPLFELTQV